MASLDSKPSELIDFLKLFRDFKVFESLSDDDDDDDDEDDADADDDAKKLKDKVMDKTH